MNEQFIHRLDEIFLVEGKRNNVYIWADLPDDFQEKYRGMLDLDKNNILKNENEPHVTFLYLPDPVKGIEPDEAYDIVKPLLKGKKYSITPEKFEIFKETSLDKDKDSDCIVVRLSVPKELKDIRN